MSILDQYKELKLNLEAKGYNYSRFTFISKNPTPVNDKDYSVIYLASNDPENPGKTWQFHFEVARIIGVNENDVDAVEIAFDIVNDFTDAWRSIDGASSGIISINPAMENGSMITFAVQITNIYE